jgi:hypothetical protein
MQLLTFYDNSAFDLTSCINCGAYLQIHCKFDSNYKFFFSYRLYIKYSKLECMLINCHLIKIIELMHDFIFFLRRISGYDG